MSKHRTIIIGAGPAGLMAAGQAAKFGSETLVFEKMSQPARKLSITGKGRSNITNAAPIQEFISRFGLNGRFLRQAFSRFFVQDLVEFFKNMDVNTITERGNRIFPAKGGAGEIANAMVKFARVHGAKITRDAIVERLLLKEQKICGVQVSFRDNNNSKLEKQTFYSDSVIIATGGASYPATGSSGDGYKLAKSVGHSIIKVRPALVPLETDKKIPRQLIGLILRNVSLSVYINEKKKIDTFGEMQFTRTGVSGPVILTISKLCVDALRDKKRVSLSIDLKPALDPKKLDSRLQREFHKQSKIPFAILLKELLPEKLISTCVSYTKINKKKTGNQISAKERKKLGNWLKSFSLQITGHRPFSEAIVTAGGVNVKEIYPKTMESRIVNGLYFAGEVLDLDADTGGYNLQAAFSTGWLAGQCAGKGKDIK